MDILNLNIINLLKYMIVSGRIYTQGVNMYAVLFISPALYRSFSESLLSKNVLISTKGKTINILELDGLKGRIKINHKNNLEYYLLLVVALTRIPKYIINHDGDSKLLVDVIDENGEETINLLRESFKKIFGSPITSSKGLITFDVYDGGNLIIIHSQNEQALLNFWKMLKRKATPVDFKSIGITLKAK